MTKPLIIGLALALMGLSAAFAGGGGRVWLPPSKGLVEANPDSDDPTSGSRSALAVADKAGSRRAFGQVLVAQVSPGSGKGESAFVPPGYIKVFADEFNEPRLDTGKWWTRYIYNGGTLDFLNDEQQRYREDRNHVMSGHSLVLVARKSGDDGPRGDYPSGLIRSQATLQYGHFETRVKKTARVRRRPAFSPYH